ncbi:hypothetical protein ADIS_0299 [Lunatimonas lonarensis]|uniref:Uncharacterized protein n=1 Tax=Lunatimonas lonarensis TaxID=1232681 RepID=R7ZYM7_9BACT|nr:hypothetical protein [Lunatimonas lonarensis]EON79190.1 hypothetical protein ADIS_0299 [Lunatimonas lonarensis]
MIENIPKQDIFQTPEGYFDRLPQATVRRYKSEKTKQIWLSGLSAAAILAVGLILAVFNPINEEEAKYQSNLDETMNLYIDAGYWTEDDILSLSENPNELLDLMLAEEWGFMDLSDGDELFENEIYY